MLVRHGDRKSKELRSRDDWLRSGEEALRGEQLLSLVLLHASARARLNIRQMYRKAPSTIDPHVWLGLMRSVIRLVESVRTTMRLDLGYRLDLSRNKHDRRLHKRLLATITVVLSKVSLHHGRQHQRVLPHHNKHSSQKPHQDSQEHPPSRMPSRDGRRFHRIGKV